MAKGKTFAEKMLRTNKGKDEFDNFKVIEAKTTPKGTVRYETKMVKIKKGDNEQKVLGL